MASSRRWLRLASLVLIALLVCPPRLGAAQETVQVESNVLYGEADGDLLPLDVYRPPDPSTAPFPTEDPVYGADVQQFVVDLLGQTPEDAPDLARDASPIFHVDDNTVPFLIAHGTLAPVVPVDQARRFYETLHTAGVDARYLEFADEGHLILNPTNQAAFVSETLAFLDWYLKR